MDTAVKNIRIVVTEYAYNWPPDISPCHKDQWGAAWENEKCMRTCDSPNRDGSGHTQKSPHNVGFTSSTFLSLDHLCHLAIPGSSYLPLGLRKWPLLKMASLIGSGILRRLLGDPIKVRSARTVRAVKKEDQRWPSNDDVFEDVTFGTTYTLLIFYASG
ncbi:hypothetical protein Moror_8698 [Moniliophthora roreri MCA 2997]|uniref:Uncharacterized protein n=2 Tax=Moniliophthora roreri TaxID=221103 RepID=V2XAP4_MONRO|nr:hypothetical protein Moror_8698 [Moniliophthora roreri MCA 2997]